MIKSVFNKVLKNATFMSWSNHVTIFAHGILVTPLLVIMFTKDQISVWYILQTLVGLGMLADAGFGHTLSRAVAFFYSGAIKLPKDQNEYNEDFEHQDEINYEKLNNLLSTASRVYLIVSVIFILLFIPIGMAVIWNVMSLTGHDFYLWAAFGLTMGTTFIILQKIKWSAFMAGTKRVGELYRFKTLVGIVKIVGFTVILTLYPSVFMLSLYALVETLFSSLYIRYKVVRWFDQHNIKRKGILFFDKEIFSSLWTATWRLGLTTWGNYLAVYGTSIIISQASNTALMANFLFTKKILSFGQRIAEAPFYANVPGIYGYMAKKDEKHAKKEISRQLFLTLSMLFAGFVFIGLWGNAALDLLNIHIRFVEGLIFFVFALSIVLDSHATMQGTVYVSTNHVPFMIPSLVSGFLMMVVGFWVFPIYGVLGLVLARLFIGLGMDNWYSTFLSLKLLKWPLKNYFYDIWVGGFKHWKSKVQHSIKTRGK